MTMDFSKVNWLKNIDLKDKVIVAEFWGTWCPACEYTLEYINKLFDRVKDLNVEIVGISHDDKETLQKYLVNHPVKYTLGHVNRDDFKEQFDRGIPMIYLLNKNQEIVWDGFAMDFLINDGHYAELEIKNCL